MKIYKKPQIVGVDSANGLVPLAAAATAITGLSAAKLLVVGAAAALASKGNNIINSFHTGTLTARKNFTLE